MPYSFIGVSCRCFYARLKKSANDTPASADEGSMKYIDKSCQTDEILVSLHIQGSFFKHIFVKYCKDFSFNSEKSV